MLASSQHNLYDIYLLLCIQYSTPDDGQKTCPKHIEFYSKNKYEKLVHLVGFIIRIYIYITMHGPLNVKQGEVSFLQKCNIQLCGYHLNSSLFPCSKTTGCQCFYYKFLIHCMQKADMEVLASYKKKNDDIRFNPQNRCTH